MQTRSIIFAGAAALLTMSATAPVFAGPAVVAPMSLSDAVAYALDHNQVIAQNYASVRSAYYNLGQARLSAFPEAVGSLSNTSEKSANYNAYAILPGVSPATVLSQNTASIGTNYTLQTGGLTFIQLAAAKAQLAQAQQTLASAEDQIANTVTTAYYSVVQKQTIVTVDRSDLDYQNHLVDDAKVKEQAGVAAGVDVLRAQVAQARSNSTLVGAQNDVTNANESLAQTIGAPLDATFSYPQEISTPALPDKSIDQLEAIGLANRPDVEAAKESLAAAQLTRGGWDRKLAPTVQLTAQFGNQLTPTNVNYEFNADGEPVIGPNGQPVRLPRTGNPGFWNLGAISTFALPLSDYGARHFERVSDDAAVANAQVALDQAKTQVDIDIRQSYRAAQTALVQLGYARDEARLGAESARIAQLQYQHGLNALTDVISAQQQSVSAQLDLISAQVTYVDAVVKLRVSLGTYDARHAVADLR